jgi:hypothetical protein
LHKKPNLLESLLQNGAEKFCKRCYIWCCKQYFSNIPQQMKTLYEIQLLLSFFVKIELLVLKRYSQKPSINY